MRWPGCGRNATTDDCGTDAGAGVLVKAMRERERERGERDRRGERGEERGERDRRGERGEERGRERERTAGADSLEDSQPVLQGGGDGRGRPRSARPTATAEITSGKLLSTAASAANIARLVLLLLATAAAKSAATAAKPPSKWRKHGNERHDPYIHIYSCFSKT